MYEEIKDCVPNNSSHQVNSRWMVRRMFARLPPNPTVVDLGCGTGESFDMFRQLSPTCSWIGVDIADSPEVRERNRTDAKFLTFDGINIPLKTNSADLVYSRQVLEHVRHPEKLLDDVFRILKSGGLLIGQTSHLEPYHSYSFWNFTPYGFRRIVEDAGFRLEQIRPSIDGATLVERTFKGRPASYGVHFNHESPLNRDIDAWGKESGRNHRQINVRKLSLCGQFVFCCIKQPQGPNHATSAASPSAQFQGLIAGAMAGAAKLLSHRANTNNAKSNRTSGTHSTHCEAMTKRPAMSLRLSGGGIMPLPSLESHHISRVVAERGLIDYEPITMASCLALCEQSSDAFVDVGANIGLFALNVADTFGRRCIAFEPATEAFAALSDTARALSLPITAIPKAISDRKGACDFYISPKSDMSHSLQKGFRKGAHAINVPVSTLNEELRSISTGVIKIDAENTELRVLTGALRILERDRPALILEILPGPEGLQIMSTLETMGYSLFSLGSQDFRRNLRHIQTRDTDGDSRNYLAFVGPLTTAFIDRINYWLDRLAQGSLPSNHGKQPLAASKHHTSDSRDAACCPICGGQQFKPYRGRSNEVCVSCGAKERTRLMSLILKRLPHPPIGSPIWHFAPEAPLSRMITEKYGSECYEALDLSPENFTLPSAVRRFDMTRDFERVTPESIGMFVHSHVLEHLPCDIMQLLLTMNSKLVPGGYHVFCVPLLDRPFDEDWSPALTDADRERRFGQHDHVRAFSIHDFDERFSSAFHGLERIDISDLTSPLQASKHAVRRSSLGIGTPAHTFVYRKAVSPADRPRQLQVFHL
jgi:FkbM family methyltransferase